MFHVEHLQSTHEYTTLVQPEQISALLRPYLSASPQLSEQLAIYLALLLKWNENTNLTSIRSEEEIVRRHFGESLFAARHLPPDVTTTLDFGSGAGFPGIPIQLLRPFTQVTLAESQNKKASFLREVVRALNLSTEVWPARVEALPQDVSFHTVTLRAVDAMERALQLAEGRASHGILLFATPKTPHPSPAFQLTTTIRIPGTERSDLLFFTRIDVPRGT